jgi:hypothetical protein
VVWLNEYYGSVSPHRSAFSDLAVCRKHACKPHGTVASVRRHGRPISQSVFGIDADFRIHVVIAVDALELRRVRTVSWTFAGCFDEESKPRRVQT